MNKRYRVIPIISVVTLLIIILICGIFNSRSIKTSDENTVAENYNTDAATRFNSAADYGLASSGAAPTAKKAADAKKAAASAKAAAVRAIDAGKPSVSHSNSLAVGTAQSNSETENKSLSERKIILSGDMSIDTNKFDSVLSTITQRTQSEGGFVQNSNVTGVKSDNGNYLEDRTASLTLRIPSDKFEAFMDSVGNLGVVTSRTTTGEDITSQYYDSTARLKSQKVKEERLLDILKKTTRLSDVLAVESELEATRYQIENLTGTLKEWDNLVEYSTLTLTINEVTVKKVLKKKPVTLSSRIKDSFNSSIKLLVDILKGCIIAAVAIFPFVVIIGLLLLIVWLIYRRYKKNASNNKKPD